jgi:uncharacterized OB-fold protein
VTVPAWFDDFADAVAAGDPEYLDCEACGEATLPPRRACPACGATDLTRRPLSTRGTVRSYTEISVTIPRFEGETPYTVVVADLDDGVSLTGQLRGADSDHLSIGDPVTLGAEARDDGPPLLTFAPA